MRLTLQWAGLFLALAAVPPLAAADKPIVAADKKEAAAKMIAAGDLTGRVVNVEQTKKMFTLELTIAYQVPNLGAMQNLQNTQVQLAQAAAKRDYNGMRNLQAQLAQQQAQMYQLKTEKHNVDIEASDDVKVRRKDPPVEFDDKGNPKKYTAKELKEFKGPDPKLPGYTGDFDSLQQDQTVHVTLSKKKEAPKKPGKEKDKDADALDDNKPTATMIIILSEPAAK
jgi:hypothetical protein